MNRAALPTVSVETLSNAIKAPYNNAPYIPTGQDSQFILPPSIDLIPVFSDSYFADKRAEQKFNLMEHLLESHSYPQLAKSKSVFKSKVAVSNIDWKGPRADAVCGMFSFRVYFAIA
jgi:hypothetical protein